MLQRRFSLDLTLCWLPVALALNGLVLRAGTIDTLAGGRPLGPLPPGEAGLDPWATAASPTGRLFIGSSNLIFELRPDGLVAVAGNGLEGFSRDGYFAVQSSLLLPADLEIAADGSLLIAEAGSFRVRRLDLKTGILGTVAGNGSEGFSGDGGPATEASFGLILDIAAGLEGDLWIADSGNLRIRRVEAKSGAVKTVAGSGKSGSSPDGTPALEALFGRIAEIAVDSKNNLFIADSAKRKVYLVDPQSGILKTYAGADPAAVKDPTAIGDGGPAAAALILPLALAFDAAGNLLIADGWCSEGGPSCPAGPAPNDLLRRVDAQTGLIDTVAGGGSPSDGLGDGGPPREALFARTADLTALKGGELWLSEGFNRRVRAIDAGFKSIKTALGNGAGRYAGDGGPAAEALFSGSLGVAVDGLGQVWIADAGNDRIRRADAKGGAVATVAGGGNPADGLGDGLPAREARLRSPRGVAVDQGGNLWIADTGNARIRRVDAQSGLIETVIGPGPLPQPLDGLVVEPAPSPLVAPADILLGPNADFWIADAGQGMVFYADAKGSLAPFAGGGAETKDGVPALSARLVAPVALARDGKGNVLIADIGDGRVRRVDPSGAIHTAAGGGSPADGLGDGLPAPQAALQAPGGLAFDGAGVLWIAEGIGGHRLRAVDPISRLIRTAAGTGEAGFSGDGGPAHLAELYRPGGIAIDKLGNVFFADNGNYRVRAIRGPGRSYSISPSAGPLSGGNVALISGSQLFPGIAGVRFGEALVSDFQVLDPNNVLLRVPQGESPAHAVDVAVILGGDRIFISGGYAYVNSSPIADPDPSSPDNGYAIRPGDPLHLDGAASRDPDEPSGDSIARYEWDLNGDGAADFEGKAVDIASGSLAQLGIVALGAYPLRLRVTDGEGAQDERATSLFVVDLRVDPASGSVNGGYAARLIGEGLSGVTSVFFGNSPAAGLKTIDPQTLEVTVPPGTSPAGPVEVVEAAGAALLPVPGGFTYLNDPPNADADPDEPDDGYQVRADGFLVLDGSASSDPNAATGDRIILFEWDLDGDGAFDRRGEKVALSPKEVQSFGLGISRLGAVTLRVADLSGAAGIDTASITVLPPITVFPAEEFRDWAGDRNANKIDDRIDAKGGSERVDIITILEAGSDLDAAALKFRGLSVLPPVKIPAITAICQKNVRVADVILVIGADPELFRVEAEEVLEADLDISAPAVRAAASAAYSPLTARDRGLTGAGVNVAFLDSGIDDDHFALAGKFVAGFNAFTDNPLGPGSQSNPDDDLEFAGIFHGTHVAGIVCGNDAVFRGVAPGARLIDVKVLNGLGAGTTATMLFGLQWCIAHKDFSWPGQPPQHRGIDILNLSLGSKARSDGKDAISMMVDAAAAQGLIVVASAGNTAGLGSGFGAPGAADGAITVGAADDRGTVDRSDDARSPNTNFGPRAGDGDDDQTVELKPDVLAPGRLIRSTSGNIAGLPAVGFSDLSGSSIAAAHVSGIAALLVEALRARDPATVKSLIRHGAEPRGAPANSLLDPTWNPLYGKGIADAFRSLPQDLGPVDLVWAANSRDDNLAAIKPAAPPAASSALQPGSPFPLAGGREPVGIAVDGNGSVWLADRQNARITKLNSAGQVLFEVDLNAAVAAAPGADLFGLAADRQNDAWATLKSSGRVARIRSSGAVDPSTYAVGAGPVAVACDRFGGVWVANSASDNVSKLDSSGAPAPGSPFTAGTTPSALVCDRTGKVYVANRGSNNVTVLDNGGSLIGTFPAGGNPVEIALDFDGNIWVSNDLLSTVTRLPPGGAGAVSFPVGIGPRGISVGGDNTLWVSIYTAGIGFSVARLAADGAVLEAVATGLAPLNHGDGTGFVYLNSVDPDGDADRDLWSNAEEIDAHTNPFDRRSQPVEVQLLNPGSGSINGGNAVIISGRGVEPPLTVLFDGRPAASAVPVPGGVQVTVPPGPFPAVGPVDVEVRRPESPPFTLPSAYTYRNDPPLADLDPDAADDGYFIILGEDLILDGSRSLDPNELLGDAIIFEWNLNGNLLAGETLVLPAPALAALGLAGAGTYPLGLQVTDVLGESDGKSTTVTLLAPGTPEFLRGNANGDGSVDIGDSIFTLGWLFLGTAEPLCLDAANVNDDGRVDLADAIVLLSYLFLGQAPPRPPYPFCGLALPKLGCQVRSCL